jgi:hypothetical protein
MAKCLAAPGVRGAHLFGIVVTPPEPDYQVVIIGLNSLIALLSRLGGRLVSE